MYVTTRSTKTQELKLEKRRGISSAGRAPALHAGGQRFDPAILHHFYGRIALKKKTLILDVCYVFSLSTIHFIKNQIKGL